MFIRIQRFHPEVNAQSYWQTYEVDPQANRLIMVLDALLWIKAHQDETLTFRRSCREGVCGSDGMNIDGKNALACVTALPKSGTVTIRPLPGMRVERDLIVDMNPFFQQYESIEPYLQPHLATPAREYRQSPEERDKLDGLYECILCGCCTSACPSYWWNPDQFAGPAALLQSARFIMDSRDGQRQKRLKQLNDKYKLFRCRTIMNCADVCPKGLNPAQAIGQVRDALLEQET